MMRSILSLITVLAPLIQACPPGWKENGEHCYFFSLETGTWAYAGSYCRNFNAKLAEPMEAADVVFIDTAVKSTHPRIGEYYLGGGDFFIEGEWIWASTLSPITNANWSPGEPNDLAGREDCLGVVLSGLWNDVPCNISLPFVCELENDFGQETIG
ncbi:perlucin-like [Mizuhopecten yessoensis]|uniref:Perlucin n=1 Tax=Mizuhopecten yessoensis TaxID=6573 RepID=A0A210QR40_MIZYE|nr:perlucin-like [Mizuhopecten yessoensis]OWF51216.1 Perlucin [Mizuhopecten yessoensis]